MAKLDKTKKLHTVIYGYLVAFDEISEPIEKAGDVLVADLHYWNPTDQSASKQMGATYAWGLHKSCVQNASVWHCEFIGTATTHAAKMAELIAVMQTPTKRVSDIAGSLGLLFSFTDDTVTEGA